MIATREDLVRIARDTLGTSECDNPMTFDPPEWAIRAMQRAYERGRRDTMRTFRALDAQSRIVLLGILDSGGG